MADINFLVRLQAWSYIRVRASFFLAVCFLIRRVHQRRCRPWNPRENVEPQWAQAHASSTMHRRLNSMAASCALTPTLMRACFPPFVPFVPVFNSNHQSIISRVLPPYSTQAGTHPRNINLHNLTFGVLICNVAGSICRTYSRCL